MRAWTPAPRRSVASRAATRSPVHQCGHGRRQNTNAGCVRRILATRGRGGTYWRDPLNRSEVFTDGRPDWAMTKRSSCLITPRPVGWTVHRSLARKDREPSGPTVGRIIERAFEPARSAPRPSATGFSPRAREARAAALLRQMGAPLVIPLRPPAVGHVLPPGGPVERLRGAGQPISASQVPEPLRRPLDRRARRPADCKVRVFSFFLQLRPSPRSPRLPTPPHVALAYRPPNEYLVAQGLPGCLESFEPGSGRRRAGNKGNNGILARRCG